ncbi:MAG: hypothetical protein Q4E37_00325 [Tissierellia bacterium]|nr:hypothetical protein [Tissierellia bacterium]
MRFETFSTKTSLSPKQKVQVVNASLTKLDRDFGLVVDLLNVSNKGIDSIVFQVKFINEMSKYLFDGTVFEFSASQLAIPPNGIYYLEPFILDDRFQPARGIHIRIKDIVFEDGQFWNITPDQEVDMGLPIVPLEKIDQLQALFGEDVITYAQDFGTYWRCVCGLTLEEETCPYCGRSKDFVLASLNEDQINQKLVSLYVQEEETDLSMTQKLYKQQLQDALDLKPYRLNEIDPKRDRAASILSRRHLVYGVILLVFFILITIFLPRSFQRVQIAKKLQEADRLVLEGRYSQALLIYESLPRDLKSIDLTPKIEDIKNLEKSQKAYQKGLAFYEDQNYLAAFKELSQVSSEDMPHYDQAQDLLIGLEKDLLTQAKTALDEGDEAQALDLVNFILNQKPKSAPALQLKDQILANP